MYVVDHREETDPKTVCPIPPTSVNVPLHILNLIGQFVQRLLDVLFIVVFISFVISVAAIFFTNADSFSCPGVIACRIDFGLCYAAFVYISTLKIGKENNLRNLV